VSEHQTDIVDYIISMAEQIADHHKSPTATHGQELQPIPDVLSMSPPIPHPHIVRVLSESSLSFALKVNLQPKDRWGRTPLMEAQQLGYVEIANKLQDAIQKLGQ
jgi:hypothetical protein